MARLRTAWRRAVHPAAGEGGLAGLLALLGPDGRDSRWDCADVEAVGPRAAELHAEAARGPITGPRLAELAAGITRMREGVFEALRPGDDGPWVAVQVVGANELAVATRSRNLLDALRARAADGPRSDELQPPAGGAQPIRSVRQAA